MFTLAICTILNGYTQINIKILLIQSYHTTCVSFSCEFSFYLTGLFKVLRKILHIYYMNSFDVIAMKMAPKLRHCISTC